MPKDATKNVDRYKIGGGHLNEYEFEQEKTADRTQRNTAKKPQKSTSQNSTPQKSVSKKSPKKK